jgi:dipeptidyl aminopeptidase/acylaminoacyl peptidase
MLLRHRLLGLCAVMLLLPSVGTAQQAYRQPPAAIQAMLDAPPTPALTLSPGRDWFVLSDRTGLPSIAEVAEPHLKLAGTRLNPHTNGVASAGGNTAMTLQRVADGQRLTVRVPSGGRLSGPGWAPDGRHFLFTQTSDSGIALYLADRDGAVRQLLGPVLNGAHGAPCAWLDGGSEILCARIPRDRGAPPARPAAPVGPVSQETSGRTAPERTYQDLLESPFDEALFAYYFATQYLIVDLDGTTTPVGEPGLIVSLSPSPDGRYFLARTLQRPFSYQVPWSRFPSRTAIWDRTGREVRLLRDQTLVDPQSPARGATTAGPRSWRWRGDTPATLVWFEALDGGDPDVTVPHRDRILSLAAPFTAQPATWLETEWRAGGIWWGGDDLALVSESWSPDRRSRTWIVDPASPATAPRLLWDRATDDRYGDPGSPLQHTDSTGRTTLQRSRDGRSLWLLGSGASAEGDRPFVDRLDLATLTTTRLWRSAAPFYETVVAAVDAERGTFITRRESREEPANYWQRDVILRRAPRQLTDLQDPEPAFGAVTAQFLQYTRDDGVALTATLYLPAGYDRTRDGPLPFLFWVYPAEFESRDAASQVRGSPYRFTRPSGASHLFLLTQGYGILDNPSFPILGVNGAEPNDHYVEQLESSARAAIDTLVAMGVADPDRIAVGGHSYGAFTTANLLAHTDLFRAGIARSGAYNRTLTPFGFQSERRTYWEAEPVYRAMSPFSYADQLDEPILFTHGMDDNNSGTFPVQSERMYAAVKGHGGTARLVMLPGEAHGYSARESVGTVLAEMTAWLDRYVKPPRQVTP